MPLFEYACRTCGHQFEALIIGARKPICPKCKSDDLEKKVSAIGFAGAGAGGGWSPGRSSGCGGGGGG